MFSIADSWQAHLGGTLAYFLSPDAMDLHMKAPLSPELSRQKETILQLHSEAWRSLVELDRQVAELERLRRERERKKKEGERGRQIAGWEWTDPFEMPKSLRFVLVCFSGRAASFLNGTFLSTFSVKITVRLAKQTQTLYNTINAQVQAVSNVEKKVGLLKLALNPEHEDPSGHSKAIATPEQVRSRRITGRNSPRVWTRRVEDLSEVSFRPYLVYFSLKISRL